MSNSVNRKQQTQKLVLGAILTAIVVILQLMGSFIRFGPFAISLVLIPIVIGAATCGYKIGAWLGFVFAMVVLLSGDASAFLTIDILGTIITVLLKGTLCGLAAGLTYKLFEKHNRYLAVISAAVVCPIVNTGIFLLGCQIFFMSTITEWGLAAGFNSAAQYMFLGLAGGNFLFELAINIILSPVILRVINYKKNK
ncbi:MAG: ECF transporter S component [Clostridia bacterium]|nr:ECF transporter S component [Clostridia bacterium]